MGETFAGKGFCEFNYLQTLRSNRANGVTHLQSGYKLLRESHSENWDVKGFAVRPRNNLIPD